MSVMSTEPSPLAVADASPVDRYLWIGIAVLLLAGFVWVGPPPDTAIRAFGLPMAGLGLYFLVVAAVTQGHVEAARLQTPLHPNAGRSK